MTPVSERVRPEPKWPGIYHRSLKSRRNVGVYTVGRCWDMSRGDAASRHGPRAGLAVAGYRLLLGYGCAKTIISASRFHINVPHALQANGTETTVSLSPSIRPPAISNAPCISERPRTDPIPSPSSSKSGPAATYVKASQEWTPSARRPGSVKPSSSGTTYTETSETVLPVPTDRE